MGKRARDGKRNKASKSSKKGRKGFSSKSSKRDEMVDVEMGDNVIHMPSFSREEKMIKNKKMTHLCFQRIDP